MASLLNYQKFIHLSPCIQRLTAPLINDLKFKTFRYVHLSSDGRVITLARHEQFLRQYFEQAWYMQECVNYMFQPHTYLPGKYCWYNLQGEYSNNNMAREFYEDHGVSNGLTIIKKYQNDLLIFEFGVGGIHDVAYDVVCTRPELLERFILYFTEQLHEILYNTPAMMLYDKNLLKENSIPDTHQSIYYEREHNQNFIEHTPIKEYYDYTLGLELDKKDILCLYYLTEGQTSRQTAKFVHLSHRTVEARLDKLRERLGCKNKSDLTRLAAKSDIRKIISLENHNSDGIYVSQMN